MLHKHHILPKHMGGSDDPSNLVELSLEEHAEAHRILFEKYGLWQDEIAWKGLSGLIGKEEIIRKVLSEAAKERLEKQGNPFSGIKTKSNFIENKENRKYASDLSKTPEAILKRKQTYSKIQHQKGEKNSQFGSMWITNGLENKKVSKNSSLQEGWRKGRVIR
jgi:hypothetical protein